MLALFQLQHVIETMIRRPAIAALAVLAATGSYAASVAPVKLNAGECSGGASAGVVPGERFNCSVTGEPEDARITVYAYSEAIDGTASQTITGRGLVVFRVAKNATPGRHTITLIAVNADKNTVDSAAEIAVTVEHTSADPQPTQQPTVSGQHPDPSSPPVSQTDSPSGYMDDRRRYISK